MTGVRSLVLAQATLAAAGSQLVATCPPGITYLVKGIQVLNANTASATVNIVIIRPGGATVYLFQKTVQAGARDGAVGWDVMEPGDTLYFVASVGSVSFWVSGSRLQGVAPRP